MTTTASRCGPFTGATPKYYVDKEPPGYRERLRQLEPLVLWDDGARRPRLVTEADWIKAGEMVFNAPVLFGLGRPAPRRASDAKTGDNYDKDGISPFSTYVVRERGKLETGEVSCGECHSRIMPDGTVIRGAQGNRPIEQVAFFGLADNAGRLKTKKNSSPKPDRQSAARSPPLGCGPTPTPDLNSSRRRRSKRFISRFRPASSRVRAPARFHRRSFLI